MPVDDNLRSRESGAAHLAGGLLDGLPDADVRAAAADVLDLLDLGVAGVGVASEQVDRGHDLSGLAVATLGDVSIQPRLLHGVQLVSLGEALDGGDVLVSALRDRGDAGVERLAVEVAGAGLADIDATAEL